MQRLAIAALAALSTGSLYLANPAPARWKAANPVRPLPAAPLGVAASHDKLLATGVTPEKVRLGRWLFFDKRLSSDGTVSCATCHRPEHGFSEPTAHSTGVGKQEGKRKSPPILNAAFATEKAYFWDGRSTSLVDQAKGPMVNPIEMGNTHEAVVRVVSGSPGYREAFRETFGDDRLDIDRIAEAIAAYESTRLSGGSRYDRFAAGETGALTAEEQEGREVFFGKGRCDKCHGGWSFSDSKFHNIGIGWKAPAKGAPEATGFADPGRFEVTKDPKDLGAFKTPTLRDVSRRAPYMHDGSAATLLDAVRAYQNPDATPHLDPEMREIHLTCYDVKVLTAFLGALDGTGYEDAGPESFPP